MPVKIKFERGTMFNNNINNKTLLFTSMESPLTPPYVHQSILSQKIILSINSIGSDTTDIIEKKLQDKIEGKCISEGYVEKHSVKIISISSGQVVDGDKILFVVVFECNLYLPVEGMEIHCIVQNITKAGIRAEIETNSHMESPFVIFIARDNNNTNIKYDEVVEGESILVQVIGYRFELNDVFISIIADFVKIAKKTN